MSTIVIPESERRYQHIYRFFNFVAAFAAKSLYLP